MACVVGGYIDNRVGEAVYVGMTTHDVGTVN